VTASGRRIVVYGDVIDDIVVVPEGPVLPDADTMARVDTLPGGSAANTAVWLGGRGADVELFGRVGAADLPRHDALLAAAGVSSRLTGDTDRPTGAAVILVQGQHRTMLTQRGANAAFDPDVVTDAVLAAARVLHVSGYVVFGATRPAGHVELIDRALAAGVAVSVDPGSSGFLPTEQAAPLRAIIERATLLFPNLDEGRALTGAGDPADVLEALARPGRVVALKLGADGCLVSVDGAAGVHVDAPAVDVVDTTGAGDAFAAGFLAEWVVSGDAVAAAGSAVTVAADAVRTPGGRPAAR